MALPVQQLTIRAKCLAAAPSFVPFPAGALEQSVPQRFEEQARRYPDRLAVRTRETTLTYAELDTLANRIAQAIVRARGREPEPIALMFGHGASAIAAMLGVLKAGKFYVPLDPSYPRQRHEQTLAGSGAALLLTDGPRLAGAGALAGSGVGVMNTDTLDGPGTSPGVCAGPRSLALIVFTSGSTGRPKGVTHSHRNVMHETMHYTNSGAFSVDDRFLLVSSVAFADSVRTIYAALLNGATLYPFDVRAEGLVPLADWLRDNAITVYRSVPTMFRHFIGSLKGGEDFRALRLIYLGGETVQKSDVELYKQHVPRPCVLVNRVGTTEAFTFRYYFIDHDTPIEGGGVPVGYGVTDKDVLVVDDEGRPVEPGVIGEIAVRSRYLSAGLWRQPELSAATFVADLADADVRTHRTGDLGRLHPDGLLEHLGRKDFQIKIRGHRIEAADVEAALRADGTLSDAVVMARRRRGDDVLVAYVVPARDSSLDAAALRRRLTSHLPAYMVPSAYVALAALPLLPNGKLDRRALPEPATTRPELDVPFLPPRNDVETAIAKIWSDLLEIDTIGVNDEFLDLGGDSLTAARIIARVSDRFPTTRPPRLLWEASTVARMAEIVR
jgi:amino acid adenylation domain-containing protein